MPNFNKTSTAEAHENNDIFATYAFSKTFANTMKTRVENRSIYFAKAAADDIFWISV